MDERHIVADNAFVEIRVWSVPSNVRGSSHHFKYSLAFIVERVCVLRYDNEAGKGDHRHIGEVEYPYTFTSPDRLLNDFWDSVDQWSRT